MGLSQGSWQLPPRGLALTHSCVVVSYACGCSVLACHCANERGQEPTMDITLKEPHAANTKPSVQLWGYNREQNDSVFFDTGISGVEVRERKGNILD